MRTVSRCLASAISKVKRVLATRLRAVCEVGAEDVHVRVGQHHGDVGEEAGPVERLDLDVDQEAWTGRWGPTRPRAASRGWLRSSLALVQSWRWTETPPPLVTKPRISSGGTGVQHFASLTHTSGAPLTTTPDVAAGAAELAALAAAGDRDGLGEVLLRALVAAVHLDDTAYDGLRRDVALADRGVERGDVGELEVLGGLGQRLLGEQPLEGQALLAHQLGDLLLALLDRLLAPLLGEPLADLGAGPR